MNRLFTFRKKNLAIERDSSEAECWPDNLWAGHVLANVMVNGSIEQRAHLWAGHALAEVMVNG